MALNDPERKEAMVNELERNALKIEDENDRQQKLISVGELIVPQNFFSIGTNLNDLKKMNLLDDDVILATCPKTGK